MADGLFNRLLAPRVILPLLLLAVVVIVLLTPVADVGGTADLTTHSAGPEGARGFYEAAGKLGWRVERRNEPFSEPLERSAVYALLAPPIPISTQEISVLLTAVREGAGLLLVLGGESKLSDSLGIGSLPMTIGRVVDSVGIPATIQWGSARCSPGLLEVDPFGSQSLLRTIEMKNTSPLRDTVTLMQVSMRDSLRAAALGGSLGLGKIVVVSDPEFLRNDILRLCDNKGGVLAIRLLEWLTDSAGGGGMVVFDEHHHGYGTHASTMRVMRQALTGNALGRAVLQVLVAALVLLMAAGVRPVAPRPRRRIERRSPLEHVGALSRAYEQIGATRRGTQLLVRGLRRRRDAATWKRGSDEEFLHAVAKRHPAVAPDVELVLGASNSAVTPADFIHVGEAIEHIERTLSSDHS